MGPTSGSIELPLTNYLPFYKSLAPLVLNLSLDKGADYPLSNPDEDGDTWTFFFLLGWPSGRDIENKGLPPGFNGAGVLSTK